MSTGKKRTRRTKGSSGICWEKGRKGKNISTFPHHITMYPPYGGRVVPSFCGVRMLFSLRLRRFSLGTPASFHRLWTKVSWDTFQLNHHRNEDKCYRKWMNGCLMYFYGSCGLWSKFVTKLWTTAFGCKMEFLFSSCPPRIGSILLFSFTAMF